MTPKYDSKVIGRSGQSFMIGIISEHRFLDAFPQRGQPTRRLFANGQPIYGKIVKPNTPKPNAQDVAKFLINDIKVN